MLPYVVGEGSYGYAIFPKNKWKKQMIDDRGKKIKNINDNKEFSSMGQAARFYGISTDLIRKSIKENRNVRSYKTRWSYQFVEI
jgi:hypothetical protein